MCFVGGFLLLFFTMSSHFLEIFLRNSQTSGNSQTTWCFLFSSARRLKAVWAWVHCIWQFLAWGFSDDTNSINLDARPIRKSSTCHKIRVDFIFYKNTCTQSKGKKNTIVFTPWGFLFLDLFPKNVVLTAFSSKVGWSLVWFLTPTPPSTEALYLSFSTVLKS